MLKKLRLLLPGCCLQLCTLIVTAIIIPVAGSAQSVRLDDMGNNFKKENLIKLNGGLSANAVYDMDAGESERQPFTWFLNGNLNARLFNLIDLPFSVFLTNAGHGLNYPTPPNRLSFHPSYKWATAHIGDVAMTFSPYTLNGHQFRGVGVDLAPPGLFKLSAMYGRLQKAESYDTANHSVKAAYERIGYGAKIGYDQNNWHIGYTAFAAKDKAGSIEPVPDSLDITPMQNVVMSLEGGCKIIKGLELNAEYATSAITNDSRDTLVGNGEGMQLLRPFIAEHSTTTYYAAYKASLNYAFAKTIIGLGFEHIDPGYQTLGAYYFNEDLENYTLNLSQMALKDKLSLSGNFGFQRDDLNGNKSGSNKRIIGAINASYTASERLNLSATYSNFQTHMHIKSQFETINQVGPYVNYDTLKFSQISQNAMLNIFYQLGKGESFNSSLNTSLTYFDAVDKQGDIISNSGNSRFYNTSIAWSLQFPKKALNVNIGFNGCYNTIGSNAFTTLGPIASLSTQLFRKKIMTSLATSYNVSTGSGMPKSNVFNIRCSASYAFLKAHSLNFSVMNQLRNSNAGKVHDLIATLSYGFHF